MGVTLALTLVLQARLAYWQVAHHGELQAMARAQHEQQVELPPNRGRLLDRHGLILASNTPVYSIFASPDQIPAARKPGLAAAIAPVLQMAEPEVLQRLQSNTKFVYLKKRVPAATVERLEALRLEGIGKLQEKQRTYMTGPGGKASMASHLLGFVNDEGKGQYGIESYYDQMLRGHPGFEATLRDLANRPIILSTSVRVPPTDGSDLILTLDSQLQFLAEQALVDGVKAAGAEGGSVIVMQPRTGEILAWASTDPYDANAFRATEARRFVDPNVAYLYEPGSVMKVVTLAGGLNEHAIAPQQIFHDPGSIPVGGYAIKNWDKLGNRDVTWTQVLEKSLNTGAVTVQQREGREVFLRYLQAFGMTVPTGIDVAGEAAQPLRRPEDWKPSELATASFGQGIAVTPIQMLTAVAAIANDGKLVWPHVVASSQAPGSAVSTPVEPRVVRQVVSVETAHQMRDMMVSVVEKGSGFKARSDNFKGRIAGKTGTAEVPEKNGYSPDNYVASFVGFLPAEDPKFCALVIIRKPKVVKDKPESYEGAWVAAPVWKQLAQAIALQQKIR